VPSDTDTVATNGIAIQDAFPVIPENYQLTVLLRNSVGKEFRRLERDVTVESASAPRIAGLVLGYKVETTDSAVLASFKLLDQKATGAGRRVGEGGGRPRR